MDVEYINEINFCLVGALVLFMLFSFMRGASGAGSNGGGHGSGNSFNFNPDRDFENLKAVVTVCGIIAVCTIVWTYFSTRAITPPTPVPAIGLDANTLAHFMSNYKQFKNLFPLLESDALTLLQKQQKLQDFEMFLNTCEVLTKNERKFALSMLADLLKVRYDDFSAYFWHADLIVKFSRHG